RTLVARDGGPANLVVGGDSAGGGLAIALALALKAENLPQPAALFVISPWTDLTHTSSYHTSHAGVDFVVTPRHLVSLADSYAGGQDPRNPLLSPVFGDLRGLPPMLIHVGSEEILLGDSLRLAERA